MEYIYFIIQEMNKYNKKRKRKGKEGSIEQMTRGSDFLRGCLATVKRLINFKIMESVAGRK